MKREWEDIRIAIIRAEAGNLFSDGPADDLLDACQKFLEQRGYKVFPPVDYDFNSIKDIDGLIELFYTLYTLHNPYKMRAHRAPKAVERKVAKSFVATRMEFSGINKKQALKDCAQIIKTVYDFKEEMKLDPKFTFNFASVFGQDRVRWITEKAVELANNRDVLLKKKLNREMQDKLEEMYDDEPDENIGYDDLDGILERIKQHP